MAAPDSLSKFLFDVAAWRGSRAIQRMSFAERGVYFEMLLEQWERRLLPDDPRAVADLIAVSEAQAAEVVAAWETVRRKFLTHPRGIYNDTLERTRRQQREYRKAKQDAGREGGKARAAKYGKDDPLRPSSAIAVLQQKVAKRSGKGREGKVEKVEKVEKRRKVERGEGERDTSPGVLEFPCDGSVTGWTLTEQQVRTWETRYPALDVLAECQKALAWVEAHADRRKTARELVEPRYQRPAGGTAGGHRGDPLRHGALQPRGDGRGAAVDPRGGRRTRGRSA
jgi:uncharacterized protein YdaU (DUF1376 family)